MTQADYRSSVRWLLITDAATRRFGTPEFCLEPPEPNGFNVFRWKLLQWMRANGPRGREMVRDSYLLIEGATRSFLAEEKHPAIRDLKLLTDEPLVDNASAAAPDWSLPPFTLKPGRPNVKGRRIQYVQDLAHVFNLWGRRIASRWEGGLQGEFAEFLRHVHEWLPRNERAQLLSEDEFARLAQKVPKYLRQITVAKPRSKMKEAVSTPHSPEISFCRYVPDRSAEPKSRKQVLAKKRPG